MSNINRVNSELKKSISYVIDNCIQDPRLKDGLVSIVSVDCDPDLTLAKVRYSIYGNNKFTPSEIGNALEHCNGFIKTKIKGMLKIRRLPELRFIYDNTMSYAAKLDKILKGISNE